MVQDLTVILETGFFGTMGSHRTWSDIRRWQRKQGGGCWVRGGTAVWVGDGGRELVSELTGLDALNVRARW